MPTRARKDELVQGRELTLIYPTCNRLGVPLEWLRRRVRVDHWIDLAEHPIDAEAFLKDPFCRRGKTLVVGTDVDIGCERQFYLEAAKGQELPSFRFAIVDPEDPEDSPELFGPVFTPTTQSREAMRQRLREYMVHIDPELRIVAIPVSS